MGEGLLWREAQGDLCEDKEEPALRAAGAERPSPAFRDGNGQHQTSILGVR